MKTRQNFLNAPFDQFDLAETATIIGRTRAEESFRYVVTPNADHVVRLNRDTWLRPAYDAAWLTLCDSKPIWAFARMRSRALGYVTGSDLTVELFRSAIQQGDRIALIVSSEDVVKDLRAAYPQLDFRAHIPPMGLVANPAAQRACIDFVVESGARIVFLAVGAPQSELLAYRLSRHPAARGVGLCVGASLEFLVGAKKRAPIWVRKCGMEWLHRLMTDPKRLWRRYVYGTLPLLALFAREAGQTEDRRLGG